jgi:hypothetical protein
VNISHLDLLTVTSAMAAITGLAFVQSIKDEDAVLAYIWGTMFGATSLAAAWSFWRLV